MFILTVEKRTHLIIGNPLFQHAVLGTRILLHKLAEF